MHAWRDHFLHILSSSSFFFWFAIRTASAQTHELAFGEMRTFPLPSKCEMSRLISTSEEGLATVAAWSVHRNTILLASFDSTLSSVKYSVKHTDIEFDDLYAADFNNDGVMDILLVNKQKKILAILFDQSPDSIQIEHITKLPFEPENILIGDFNNDKNLDVLVYAHNVPGVYPLKGNGRGSFFMDKVIAPDNAIGAADFIHVNNDNLIDLVIWDWVKCELHILYGVGKGRFIDQSVFPIKGDVEQLYTASNTHSRSLELLLKMKNPSEFQIWEGNDFGDFQLKDHIPMQGRINNFTFADINNDGLSDVIAIINSASLQVVLNNDSDPFSERAEYACGVDPRSLFTVFSAWDGLRDCIVFDARESEFLLYRNAAKKSDMKDSIQMVSGVAPASIVAGDFNRDGISDIAVANTQSSSLSVYYGQKDSNPLGPFSYTLSEKPGRITFYSSSDSSLQFIFSYPQTKQISYFVLDPVSNSISNAFIGCEGDASVVATTSTKNDRAEFVTFNTTHHEGNSLSFFEQYGQNTFIERTFRLSSPDELLGASIVHLNRDSLPDIVYVYRVGDTSTVELSAAFGDSSYSMKRRVVLKELELPDVKQLSLNFFDFDGDSVMDLVMYAGHPSDYLMVARGSGEGLYDDPKILISGFPIADRSDMQFLDVDQDGLIDIVAGSQSLGRISWFRNEGKCIFGSERILYTDIRMNHYVLADINADGVYDLIMTFTKNGVIHIINGMQLSVR